MPLSYRGKMRLSKEAYYAMQPIYYPGFTIGGFAEPAGLILTIILLFVTPLGTRGFLADPCSITRAYRYAGNVLAADASGEQVLASGSKFKWTWLRLFLIRNQPVSNPERNLFDGMDGLA